MEPAELLDALPEAAAVRTSTGRLLLANRAWLRLFELTPEEAAELDEAGLQGVISARMTAPDSDAPLERKRPGDRFFQLSGQPATLFRYELFPLPGSPAGRTLELWRRLPPATAEVEAARLSERQQESQVVQLQNRLEQLESYKSELTANVTHDLRTPLASIKASVSGLLDGELYRNVEVVHQTLVLVDEACDRLQRRVQNLLSLARMESGAADLVTEWVDIHDVVRAALESMQGVLQGRDVRLDFGELPLVRADYLQIEVAIRNLVENACLYSPADRPIEISGSTSLGSLRVRVRDYGPGLIPDEFERVFDKFYRGRAARKIPGTGIGLAICRGIATAHGGMLWAEHAAGGGVAFVLSLPAEEDEPSMDDESVVEEEKA